MDTELLQLLRAGANHGGLVMRRAPVLERQLRCSRAQLTAGIAALVTAGEVRVLSPIPFLALRLTKWAGHRLTPRRNVQQISSSGPRMHKEVPVSSAAAAATQQREVGGAGEGESLLEIVLAALGPEARREEFAQILARHPRELIHRCLTRVKATKSIRVSRAALFRSLLERFSH